MVNKENSGCNWPVDLLGKWQYFLLWRILKGINPTQWRHWWRWYRLPIIQSSHELMIHLEWWLLPCLGRHIDRDDHLEFVVKCRRRQLRQNIKTDISVAVVIWMEERCPHPKAHVATRKHQVTSGILWRECGGLGGWVSRATGDCQLVTRGCHSTLFA